MCCYLLSLPLLPIESLLETFYYHKYGSKSFSQNRVKRQNKKKSHNFLNKIKIATYFKNKYWTFYKRSTFSYCIRYFCFGLCLIQFRILSI